MTCKTFIKLKHSQQNQTEPMFKVFELNNMIHLFLSRANYPCCLLSVIPSFVDVLYLFNCYSSSVNSTVMAYKGQHE